MAHDFDKTDDPAAEARVALTRMAFAAQDADDDDTGYLALLLASSPPPADDDD